MKYLSKREYGTYSAEFTVPIDSFFFEKINEALEKYWDPEKNSCELVLLNEDNFRRIWAESGEVCYWKGDFEQSLSDFISDSISDFFADFGVQTDLDLDSDWSGDMEIREN